MNRSILKLLIAVISALLIFLAVSACTESPADTDSSGSTDQNMSSGPDSSSDTENSTQEVTTSRDTAPSTQPPEMLTDETQVVPSDGKISIPSASYISGHLVAVDKHYLYAYNIPSLVKNSDIKSSHIKFPAQNLMIVYGNKSSDYLIANSKIFIKSDAFTSLEALMSAFKEDTGEDFIQLVSAYTYSGDDSLTNPFVTGYSVALNILDGSTYPLTSEAKKVTSGGESMTALEWFQLHCAEHGFIYTGMSGSEGYALATFRYVGVPHAAIMYEKDIIDLRYYSNHIQVSGGLKTVVDGIEWTVDYIPASDSEYTEYSLQAGYVYTVSGDNADGFIIAYHAP